MTVYAQTNIRQTIPTSNIISDKPSNEYPIVYYIPDLPEFLQFDACNKELYGWVPKNKSNKVFVINVYGTDGTLTTNGSLLMASFRIYLSVNEIPKDLSQPELKYSLVSSPTSFIPFIRLFGSSPATPSNFTYTIPEEMFVDKYGRQVEYSISNLRPLSQMPWLKFDSASRVLLISMSMNDALLGLKDNTLAPFSQTPSSQNSTVTQNFTGIVYASLPLMIVSSVLGSEQADMFLIPIVLSFIDKTPTSQQEASSIPSTQIQTMVNSEFTYILERPYEEFYTLFLTGNLSTSQSWLKLNGSVLMGSPKEEHIGIWRVYLLRSNGNNSGFSLYPNSGKKMIRGIGEDFHTVDINVSADNSQSPQVVSQPTSHRQFFSLGPVENAFSNLSVKALEYFEYRIPNNATSSGPATTVLGQTYPWWIQNCTVEKRAIVYFGYPELNFTFGEYFYPQSLISINSNETDPVMVNYSEAPLGFLVDFTAENSPIIQLNKTLIFNSELPMLILKRLNGSVNAQVKGNSTIIVQYSPERQSETSAFSLIAQMPNNGSMGFFDFTITTRYSPESNEWAVILGVILGVVALLILLLFMAALCLRKKYLTKRKGFKQEKNISKDFPKVELGNDDSFPFTQSDAVAQDHEIDVPMCDIPLYESFDFSWQNVLDKRLSEFEEPIKRLSLQKSVLFAPIGKPFHFKYPLANMAQALGIPKHYVEAFDNIPVYTTPKQTPNCSRDSFSLVQTNKLTLENEEVWNASRYSNMNCRDSYMSYSPVSSNKQDGNENSHIIVVFSARLASGADLPSWLHFNPKLGSFYGIPSYFDRMIWEIEIIGHRIDVNAPCPQAYGDATFSGNVMGNQVKYSISDIFIVQVLNE